MLDPAQQLSDHADRPRTRRNILNDFLFILAMLAAIAAFVVFALVLVDLGTRLISRPCKVGSVHISSLADSTHIDTRGAVRSLQAADMQINSQTLEAIWTPMNLERLAHTYWRFLTRCTLGLIQIKFTDNERLVVFLCRPFVLLAFRKPEFKMDELRGIVRWRIERGLLVAALGIDGDGYLEIDVARKPSEKSGMSTLHVDVEIANYFPQIAALIAQWFYAATQSKIHVLVCYAFLRSIARGDLAQSTSARFAPIEQLPTPSGPRPRDSGAHPKNPRRSNVFVSSS